MKKLIFALSVICLLISCKGEKPIAPVKNNEEIKTDQTVIKSPAVRDGNVIRQKVTVGGNQTQNSNIDAITALKMMEQNPNTKVIDVRTPKEVAEGIYPNAMHININDADFKSKISKLNKEDSYIVYCKSGGRSGKAVSMMRALGFNKSYNMMDGYSGLAKASKN